MAKRCSFKVDYIDHRAADWQTARFSSRVHAHMFAKWASLNFGAFADVQDAQGDLIGQYSNGKLTPEFEGYDYDVPALPPFTEAAQPQHLVSA